MVLSLVTLLKQAARFRRSPVRLRSLPRLLVKRGSRSLRSRFASGPRPALSEALAAAKLDFDDLLEGPWPGGRLFVQPPAERLEALRRIDPARVRSTLERAERLLLHEFRLLGSDTFVPRRPDAGAGPAGYQPIDWVLDPVSGLRFPEGIPHAEWDLYAMRPGMADIKLPWELARCQHWPTLGQAYLLSGDPRYAVEMSRQLADFDQANPTGIGINWTCTMDVALRALNWVLGLALVRECDELPAEFWRGALSTLYDHGQFIMANLENTYEVTSNHYLSNVVGLYALGKTFRLLPQGRRWEEFCFESLHREIEVQTLEDGADFESSVPYHRLVAELFLSSARLGQVSGTPFAEAYDRRLAVMVEYLAAVVRPDGLLPQLGDADDGRAHILSDYGSWNPQDGRHLLAPAGHYFGRPEWLELAGEVGPWEAAWWGYELPSRPAEEADPPPVRRLFPKAGVAVVREAGNMLLITNGVVGTEGFGNHKHNDLLSFEYHLAGQPVVVDPGSFVYTSDPEARNRFRGTGYHNTLAVDGEEQNEFNPEWLFRMFESANPEHLEFRDEDGWVEYRGRHTGYERLPEGVTHERHFRYAPRTGVLLLRDTVRGSGRHRLRWHFHLAPGVEADPAGPGVLELRRGGLRLELRLPPGLRPETGDAWYSPSYGVRIPCRAAEALLETPVDERSWGFALGPPEELDRLPPEALAELTHAP